MANKGPVKAPLKLMLLADVKGLGSLGDVVRVRPGFARNYLLPRGMATKQSGDAQKRVEAIRKKAAAEAQKSLEQAKAAAAALANVSIHIESRAGEGGHLFGSVTAAMIAEALNKQNVAIDAAGVLLEQPIKQLGIYDIKLKLHGDVDGTVKLYVVATAPEKAPEPAKAAKAEKPAKAEKKSKK
jgi:large subunit ribosomal protein L9